MKKRIHNIHELMERRRLLRKQFTPQEVLLWESLRSKKLGYKFRRQHSIGYYIADFFCTQKRLILEIDGKQHDFNKGYDTQRDQTLEEMDYRVLRIKNTEIDHSLKKVIEKIKNVLQTTSP